MKILWLSDIHFRGYYNEVLNGDTTSRFSMFIKKFIKTIRKIDDLTYILISGDLAYSGKEEDYVCLNKFILKEVSNNNTIPIITVSGNHDLDWDNSFLSLEKISKEKLKEKLGNKNKIFDDDKDNYLKKHFSAYSSFCKRNFFLQSEKTEKSDFEASEAYQQDRLHGYLIDRKHRVRFIFINSSWFSLGKSFNDSLVNNYNHLNKRELLDLKDVFNEYKGQIIGRSKLVNELKNDFISKYSDYTTITVFHHPISWLEWNEYFGADPERTKDMLLNKVLNASDVLLTGHEHVPEFAEPVALGNGHTWHFQAGMFLQDEVSLADGQDLFPNNRFSILEIEEDCRIKETRYKFSEDSSDWKISREHCYEFKRASRKTYSLSEDHKNHILEKFYALLGTDKIKCFKIFTDILFSLSDENFIYDKDTDYIGYLHENKIIVISINNKFYQNLNEQVSYLDNMFMHFKERMPERQITEVRIFSIDINSIIDDKKDNYGNCKSKEDRAEVFQNIIINSDQKFNHYRMKFYKRFADKQESKLEFEKFRKIGFINSVMSYWTFEKKLREV